MRPTVLQGDLFASKAQTLVNTVNTVGVMGKGVALEFKKRYPDMFEDYSRRCQAGEVRLGEPYLYRRSAPPWILNFPTKGHWRSVSRISDIVRGLEHLKSHYQGWGIRSLALPPLGCGQGQLEWRVVGPTLYRHLRDLDIPVELYAPHGTPAEHLQLSFLDQPTTESDGATSQDDGGRMRAGWIALVEILARIDRERYHWPIGRTAFQKLAYFATEAGIPTGLHFERGSYGPFSAELKPLITRLVNNGLIREEQLGKMFSVGPGPTYRDAARAYGDELEPWEPKIDRVVDLFLRMRTQDAEVAATVFFAAHDLAAATEAPSEIDVFDEVKRWKQRRRPPLADEEIARAIRNLNVLRWLSIRPSSELPLPDTATADV